MKGVYYRTNVSGFDPIPDVTDRIWDVADYVVPAEVKLLHFVIFLKDITYFNKFSFHEAINKST